MKILFKSILILCLLVLAGYIAANFVLKKMGPKALEEIRAQLDQKGIEVKQFEYEDIQINSYNSAELQNVSLEFQLDKKVYGNRSYTAQFRAESVSARLANLNNPVLFFTLDNFSIIIEPEDKTATRVFAKLNDGNLQTGMPLYLESPFESAKAIIADIEQLFREDYTLGKLSFTAKTLLGIDNKELDVRMFTERKNDTTFLRFDKNDIRHISNEVDLDLVDAEIEVIARHPSKVPAMIKITMQAKLLSGMEKAQNPQFPEDAFRHLYWSYHLTREFGPKLAKEITDAHETAPGNTQNERLMDYHNNEVARMLARQKLTTAQLKQLALQSARVIRNPDEVPQKIAQ